MENKKVILSADSTCDLGDELKEQLNVSYYPFHIVWHGDDYQDNIDITTDEIFAGYHENGSLPKTAAINEQEYIDYFTPFVESGCEVVHLNLGSAISSAHENAKRAAEKLEGVFVVDSQNLSTGIGLLLIHAAKCIEEGMSGAEVAAQVEGLRCKVRSSFVLDTLDFMAAGGRCPSIVAHVGKKLKFRPEIVVDNSDGSMSVGKLYRGTMPKVLGKYVGDELAKYSSVRTEHVFVTHTGDDDVAEEVARQVGSILPFQHVHITKASCTIGAHCGPGTLGVLFVAD